MIGRRTAITSLVDLTRTVVELAGCEVDEADLDGRVLTGLLEGREHDGGGVAFSEYEAHGTDRPARMVRRGRFKLNYYPGEPVELFDVVADPGEPLTFVIPWPHAFSSSDELPTAPDRAPARSTPWRKGCQVKGTSTWRDARSRGT